MPEQKTVSMDRARTIFRAMNGDREAGAVVTWGDVEGLENAPTFEKFLLWNKAQLEVSDLNYAALLS